MTSCLNLSKWLRRGAGFAGAAMFFFMPAGISAHSWVAECNIDFDDSFALSNLLDQARNTFAVRTGRSPSGDLESCDARIHRSCWIYRQRCGSPGYVKVDENQYGHFHLSFEDKWVGRCIADGGFGRRIGDRCEAANWVNEPRILNTHTRDHWINVWLADRVSGEPRVFDVVTIKIKGAAPVQFWFKKRDGRWWYWPRLGPGWWNLSSYVFDVVEVKIRGADGGLGTIGIDDLVIRA